MIEPKTEIFKSADIKPKTEIFKNIKEFVGAFHKMGYKVTIDDFDTERNCFVLKVEGRWGGKQND